MVQCSLKWSVKVVYSSFGVQCRDSEDFVSLPQQSLVASVSETHLYCSKVTRSFFTPVLLQEIVKICQVNIVPWPRCWKWKGGSLIHRESVPCKLHHFDCQQESKFNFNFYNQVLIHFLAMNKLAPANNRSFIAFWIFYFYETILVSICFIR